MTNQVRFYNTFAPQITRRSIPDVEPQISCKLFGQERHAGSSFKMKDLGNFLHKIMDLHKGAHQLMKSSSLALI
ncbi:hypothetical protein ACN47E_006355 [Coniothyrium glycines]